MLRVLIAEDSMVIQRTLRALLEGEEGIEIVGVAGNGRQAVEMARQLRPDLITMDIFMPEMDGLEATQLIMEQCPTRIVIISAMVGDRDVKHSFEAMRAGAVEVIAKPHGVLAGNYSEVKYSLAGVLRRIAKAKPVARTSLIPRAPSSYAAKGVPCGPNPQPPAPPASQEPAPSRTRPIPDGFTPEIICIGGSTGAPSVLVEVLSSLPADYPFPVVVAQHIARGFAPGLASWLDASVPLEVRLAERAMSPVPGRVLIAPDDHHMEIGPDRKVRLLAPASPQEHIPSVDVLFESVARAYGKAAVGVLLSGMGRDGAQGTTAMYLEGAVTMAQNEATSVVYGMAKVASDAGVVMKLVSPQELSEALLRFRR